MTSAEVVTYFEKLDAMNAHLEYLGDSLQNIIAYIEIVLIGIILYFIIAWIFSHINRWVLGWQYDRIYIIIMAKH